MDQPKQPIKYYYLHHPTVKSVVTVATLVSNNKVNLGFAFCSPKDTFVKAIGRSIALGRLQSKKGMIRPESFTGKSFNAIVKAWDYTKKPQIWEKIKIT